MINIKAYAVPKSSGGSSSNSLGSSGNIEINGSTSLADEWFYYNDDYDAVCCRHNFYSVGSVAANGAPPEEGVERDDIVDNLTSNDKNKALSANMGRVIKSLIDEITTTSGGQAVITIDWSNVTNKPSTFTPESHTHNLNDINNLQNTINAQNANISNINANLTSHTGNNNIHLTSEQKNKLDSLTPQQITKLGQLIDMITINTSSNTVTLNGTLRTVNDVTAHV